MFDKKLASFVTALGTPVDEQGDLLEQSFRLHINDQLDQGQVDGFLVLGTMGQMPCLKLSTYQQCAKAACAEVGEQAKILIGVGGNSIEQTMGRIEMLQGLRFDAVVSTTPYY